MPLDWLVAKQVGAAELDAGLVAGLVAGHFAGHSGAVAVVLQLVHFVELASEPVVVLVVLVVLVPVHAVSVHSDGFAAGLVVSGELD